MSKKPKLKIEPPKMVYVPKKSKSTSSVTFRKLGKKSERKDQE